MIAGVLTIALAAQFSGAAWDNALADGDKVHVFLPPIFVSEGSVSGAAWSEDGRYLIVVTESVPVSPTSVRDYVQKGEAAEPEQRTTLDIVNARTGVTRRLWESRDQKVRVAMIVFFPASDIAVIELLHAESSSTLMRVTGGTSRVEILERLPQFGGLSRDPTGKYIASFTSDPPTVRFIAPSGPGHPRRSMVIGNGIEWTTEGLPVVAFGRNSYAIVTPGGQDEVKQGVPTLHQLPWTTDRRLRAVRQTAPVPGREEPIDVVAVMVEGDGRRLPIAFGANFYGVQSDSGVFYQVGYVNLVQPVIQVTKEAWDEVLARVERSEAIQRLGNVGKALIMYSGDNDDKFPTQEELAESAIQGYLGDPSLLKGFVYTGGTDLSANPSQTEMGYTLVSGGRVVVFQDGHVVFVPDRS